VHRNHGKLLMSQAQVDELCAALAEAHYMQTSSTTFAAIPREARGLPHYAIPGLHAYLDDYYDALQSARKLVNPNDRRCKDSLQCLPFSPYSERLSPYTSEDANAEMRFRNPDDDVDTDGRSFLIDGTCEDVSIVREPLMARASMTSAHDCVFSSSRPFVGSFLILAGGLAALAREAYLCAKPWMPASTSSPRDEIQHLKSLLDAFHVKSTGGAAPVVDHLWAADAMVMLSGMYPSSSYVGEPTIMEAYELAVARVASAMERQRKLPTFALRRPVGASLTDLNLDAARLVRPAQAFWSAFSRPDYTVNSWAKLEPLLIELLEKDGSFDNSIQDLDRFQVKLETAIRGVWFVHSCDGRKPPEPPSPLAGVRSSAQVRAHHLTPVFVGGKDSSGARYEARGSVVGIPAMGLQQLIHLMIGAGKDASVRCQYFVNQGQLCFRASSAADVMTSKNRDRSAKAISAVGVEGDELAFGARAEKLVMCRKQRTAYTSNLDLVKPLVTNISAPKPETDRVRGDWRAVEFIKARKQEYERTGVVPEESACASHLLSIAAGIAKDQKSE
tara:strand:+ start:2604 stop:4280 length:1677 start_codon:yes stop_codon:yes gene_type:complete